MQGQFEVLFRGMIWGFRVVSHDGFVSRKIPYGKEGEREGHERRWIWLRRGEGRWEEGRGARRTGDTEGWVMTGWMRG